ncbi:MAG: tetratricopeptide repeat protein, partial [Acidobacteria bacterium]|nr:tetratricopeptide repeat protein [Acidobacteriota bacterium]
MISFSKRSSSARSQALLMSIILSLTIISCISCVNSSKPVKSLSNTNSASSAPLNVAETPDPNQLQVNKVIERELAGGDLHSYTIKLEANQYLNAVVEQKGIDIVATLYSPNGEKVYEVDSPNGTEGEEPVYFISQTAGNYRLEVRSLEKQAKAGNYEIKVNELRTSVTQDIDRVTGYKALGEAVLLMAEGKKQNEGLVINKYEEAIEKFDRANELVAKVNGVDSLARFYENKGEYANAESLYIQALEINRKMLGDNHPTTAVSINNLALLYSRKGDYIKAEALYLKTLEIYRKTLGENHRETATSISNLANLYNKKGDYTRAEKMYIQALEISRKAFGDNHALTANKINNLSALYYNKGDYSKAEPLLIQALAIYRKVLGENHPDTGNSINNLAALYYDKGENEKAELLYIQAIEILKKSLGDNNLETINSISNLANVYSRKGEYAKSEPLYIQALAIRKKILGENHPDTANSINNLARLYERKGDYQKAESLYLQALDIRRKVLGDNHPDTIVSINGLAALYYSKGNYEKAEPLYLQALDIRRKVLGVYNLNTAQSMSGLAGLYEKKGDYEKAESLYLQALDIQKKILGNNHPSTAGIINNLAGLYKIKGDYEKAESLYLQALEFNRNMLGENHPQTAQFINNLAVLYYGKGDYEKAEPLYLQALDIRRKVLGDNHLDTVQSINNLAELYRAKRDYEKAEPLYLQALDTHKKVLGEYNPFTATSINNLALLYFRKGEYEKAEGFLFQSLKMRRQVLSEDHPDITNSIYNLAGLYHRKGEYEKVVKYSKEGNDVRERELTRNLALGSERQKRLYLQKYAYETDITLSLHVQNAPNNLEARQSALTEVLRRKGRSIDAVNQSVEALRKRSSPEDIELLDKLSEKTAYLSNLTTQGLGKRTPEEYQKLLKSVEEEIEELQYKISERSAEFRTISKPITLEAVQKVVPRDATLVEFASYRPYDAKTRVYGAPRYVVYLLNNEGESDWVDLGLAEPIDKLVDSLRVKLSDGKSSVNREIKPLARKLDKLLMQDVRRLVGRGKTLLIAPDGKLNLLPFAALVDERGKFLVENNKISYLTSGRDLLRLEIKIENKQAPVIIGDPDFGPIPDVAGIKEGSTLYARLGFNRLASTELEAKAIKELFPDAELLLQQQANEEALNKLNAPLILHIATHGFFLQEEVAAPPTSDEMR